MFWQDLDFGLGLSGKVLLGTHFNDGIIGSSEANFIFGGQGSDTIRGHGGNDVLLGGTGQDFLSGNRGSDVFLFTKSGDAGQGDKADVIVDFSHKVDKIDLVDFMCGGHFIGAADFSAGHGAEVRYDQGAGMVSGDVDADGRAEFQIFIANHAALTAFDFIL